MMLSSSCAVAVAVAVAVTVPVAVANTSSVLAQLGKRTQSHRDLSARPMSMEFERVFHYFDQNGDGKISPAELRSCMIKIGWEEQLSEEDVIEVVELSDSDGDGMLGYDDFVKLVGGEEEEEEKHASIREAFKVYEMGGRGYINEQSLRSALEGFGEKRSLKECRNMIKEFDLNGDGVICFEEFWVMMQC